MIAKKDVEWIGSLEYGDQEEVIRLSVVERLKQELKARIHKIRQTQSIYENVSWEEIQEALNDVFGVEGEK